MELSADTINAVEDWVSRLEQVARSISDSAFEMKRAAEQHDQASKRFSEAARGIPHSIRMHP